MKENKQKTFLKILQHKKRKAVELRKQRRALPQFKKIEKLRGEVAVQNAIISLYRKFYRSNDAKEYLQIVHNFLGKFRGKNQLLKENLREYGFSEALRVKIVDLRTTIQKFEMFIEKYESSRPEMKSIGLNTDDIRNPLKVTLMSRIWTQI